MPQKHKLRWVIILYGIAVFFWLGPEDESLIPVILLGLCGAFLLVYVNVKTHTPLMLLIWGAVVGIGTSLITVVLMLFKNARHAHLFPDFSAQLMGEMLIRAPYWGLVGALIGLGIGLWETDRCRKQEP